MEKRYFKNIDFLRFVFAVIIVTLHTIGIACSNIKTFPLIHYIRSIDKNMPVCVELFFIISGFFLIVTLKKDLSVIQFLKNKFIRLSPVIIFTVCLFLITAIFKITKFYFIDNLFSIFFLNGLNIANHHSPYGGLGNVHSSWYVSVLVFISMIFFSIIKKYGFKLFNLIIPVLIVLGLYWKSYNIKGAISFHLIRGIYAIGIGTVLGIFYLRYKDSINNVKLNISKRLILTLLEGGILAYLLYGIITTKSHLVMTDIIFLFVILFILFIIRGGYISELLNNDFSVKLGSYSYSIYITHNLWLDIFKKYLFTPDIAKVYPEYIGGGGSSGSIHINNFWRFNLLRYRKTVYRIFKKEIYKGE